MPFLQHFACMIFVWNQKYRFSVCGHHTDGYRHENLKDETVYLHCCADFETDEKDRFRIAGMQPYGSNRDGTALWYAGSRLLERPENAETAVCDQ